MKGKEYHPLRLRQSFPPSSFSFQPHFLLQQEEKPF